MSGEEDATVEIDSPYQVKYEKLSPSLKACLDYCSLLSSLTNAANNFRKKVEEERLVRLMVVEGLIPEIADDDSCLENISFSLINQLIDLEMLIPKFYHYGQPITNSWLEIPDEYCKLCVVEGDRDKFLARSASAAIRVFICVYDDGFEIPMDLKNLPIHSLFFQTYPYKISQPDIDFIRGLESLFVLEFEGWTPDFFVVISELINLKVLRLRFAFPIQILPTFGNFKHLQTLESSSTISEEAVHVTSLKHLIHVRFPYRKGLPKGIGKLVNLLTLVGFDATSDCIDELGSLIQLRRLHVDNVADENISKLLETILTMKNLVSLSMEGEIVDCSCFDELENVYYPNFPLFPFLEPFSPPPLLENPCLILQFLPKLRYLHLNNAYRGKLLGKDFCFAGNFPKLEKLVIASSVLVEWTEIVVGAFPKLSSLEFRSCPQLMFFPEGLGNIRSLGELYVHGHNDMVRRLNGDEHYKIKHIPSVQFYSF